MVVGLLACYFSLEAVLIRPKTGSFTSRMRARIIPCSSFTLAAFLLQFVTQVLNYPTFVQDKPANIGTLPAFFPVMFELTVLFSAFTALFGSMILNRLPRWNHPLFASEQFERFSDDAFFLCIEARDPQFSKDETLKMLKNIGGKSIELIEDDI